MLFKQDLLYRKRRGNNQYKGNGQRNQPNNRFHGPLSQEKGKEKSAQVASAQKLGVNSSRRIGDRSPMFTPVCSLFFPRSPRVRHLGWPPPPFAQPPGLRFAGDERPPHPHHVCPPPSRLLTLCKLQSWFKLFGYLYVSGSDLSKVYTRMYHAYQPRLHAYTHVLYWFLPWLAA